MNTNEIVVKYLPIPLAVMVANIVLRVKPIEEIFAKQEYAADPLTTRSFLVTKHGIPVEPLGMAALLASSLEGNGLDINLSGLRHALEAFSHKLPQQSTLWNKVYADLANHNMHTSAGYGRDQNSFCGIPADLCENNCAACNDWNSIILDSPSSVSELSKESLKKQLLALGLLDDGDTSFDVELESSSKSRSGDVLVLYEKPQEKEQFSQVASEDVLLCYLCHNCYKQYWSCSI